MCIFYKYSNIYHYTYIFGYNIYIYTNIYARIVYEAHDNKLLTHGPHFHSKDGH